MRIDPLFQNNNIVLQGSNQPSRPQLTNHSSISTLQNETCCGSIKKWFGNLVTSISHGFQRVGQFFENLFNRICCCCLGRDRQPPITRIPLDQALERQNQALAMLLNRGEIDGRFHRIQVAPDIQDGVVPQERVNEGGIDGLLVNQGPFQHLQFAQVPQFKAAVILMLDDVQCVGYHQARINMEELENRFRGETAHILEQAIMQRAQNDALRGRILRTFLVMVIDREDGRFDGGIIHEGHNALERVDFGRSAWPEGLTPELLAQHIFNILPGNQNTAARNQLTAFFQARDNNPQQ